MRILVFVMVLLSLLNANAKEINRYADVHYYELDNGLKVYLLSDDKAENTQIMMKVNVGVEVEEDTAYGLSHLVEHLVFRDQRIPHRDYLDYIKEEGGTYINGYTKRYQTEYLTTIDSSKSYWIAETFAQMLFDKNVTDLDLVAEKGAVQTEIGEYKWSEKLLWGYIDLFKTLSPPREDIYRDEFSLDEVRELPARYLAKQNNAKFSLEQVMEHYETYYYPSNMTLMIAGKFDLQKMKKLIEKKYGVYRKEGTALAQKPLENPRLNHKPYRRFYEGAGKNLGYIGAKYILDSYKKYLIVDAYMANVSSRILKHLRNKMGKSYSVGPYLFNERKAGVASVAFDGLRDDFESNIEFVKKTLLDDVAFLDDETISTALDEYETKKYASTEHDSSALMSLVSLMEYLRVDQGVTDTDPYAIFSSITHEEFRETLKEVFTPENSYSVIQRDYYYFPYEMFALSLFMILLFALVYFKMNRIDYYAKGLSYTKRDLLIDRRLSNRFLGFFKILFVFLLSSFAWEWIKYLASTYMMGDPYCLFTVDVPYSYVVTVSDAVFGIILFLVIYRYMFNYYAHADVTKDAIYLVGNRITVIEKEMIEKINVAKWSLDKFLKTKGLALFFWRPLVEVELKNGVIYYLRASDANHLKEDLHKCLEL